MEGEADAVECADDGVLAGGLLVGGVAFGCFGVGEFPEWRAGVAAEFTECLEDEDFEESAAAVGEHDGGDDEEGEHVSGGECADADEESEEA